MVYIKEIIKSIKSKLLSNKNLQIYLYYYIKNNNKLLNIDFKLNGDEEKIATEGYLCNPVDKEAILKIINKKPIKGLDFSTNIYKLIGLYLAAPDEFKPFIEKKYNITTLKNKYLITKIIPDYLIKFNNFLEKSNEKGKDEYFLLFSYLLLNKDDDINVEIINKITENPDIIDLLILEDLNDRFISNEIGKVSYLNFTEYELITTILNNFGNAIKKITQNRRANHVLYTVKDEYDIQDLLYVILKSIFPKIKIEEPTPKVGAKFNKIDLINIDEGIMIEIKMLKESDLNEKKVINELKIDIQSYYKYPKLKYLICFIFDPFNKIQDENDLFDLAGVQTINDITFEIKIIINR